MDIVQGRIYENMKTGEVVEISKIGELSVIVKRLDPQTLDLVFQDSLPRYRFVREYWEKVEVI